MTKFAYLFLHVLTDLCSLGLWLKVLNCEIKKILIKKCCFDWLIQCRLSARMVHVRDGCKLYLIYQYVCIVHVLWTVFVLGLKHY